MSALSQICDTCNTKIKSVFDPTTGTRDVVIITGDMFVSDCCFVADEIVFLNGGRLIFVPSMGTTGKDQKGYCQQYAVVCRKLTVKGGHKPVVLDPCKAGDPGSTYENNNAISWKDRLNAAADGTAVLPSHANNGDDFGAWQDKGQGDNGANGGGGDNGQQGNRGGNGKSAPSLVLVALEVDIGLGDVLIIDFDGQDAGDGSDGQDGGRGGHGMHGHIGKSDTTWPGTGCDRSPGNGGKGGNGGNGGSGGDGGNGGNSGNITLVSTAANLAVSGPFFSGNFVYVYDGGSPGTGGLGGHGGVGGAGGGAGTPTSECDPAVDGIDGSDGDPPPGFGSGTINKGATGNHGAGGTLKPEQLPAKGSCADLIPAPIKITGALNPNHYCRDFNTPETAEGTLTGTNLGQVTAVDVSLPNITVTVKNSSTDTELDLRFDMAGNGGTGNADLILHRSFGPDVTVPAAASFSRFEVLGMVPNTGQHNKQVAVTINGNCFDPTAVLQQVNVSGIGVDVLNVLIVDEHTISCVFDIATLAAQTARDITVKTGTRQHTLIGGFTVT